MKRTILVIGITLALAGLLAGAATAQVGAPVLPPVDPTETPLLPPGPAGYPFGRTPNELHAAIQGFVPAKIGTDCALWVGQHHQYRVKLLTFGGLLSTPQMLAIRRRPLPLKVVSPTVFLWMENGHAWLVGVPQPNLDVPWRVTEIIPEAVEGTDICQIFNSAWFTLVRNGWDPLASGGRPRPPSPPELAAKRAAAEEEAAAIRAATPWRGSLDGAPHGRDADEPASPAHAPAANPRIASAPPLPPPAAAIFRRGGLTKLKGGRGDIEGEAIPLDTPEPKFQDYFNQVRERIKSKWIYPYEASSRGVVGELQIEFGIAKSGELQFIEKRHSSRVELLDDYAMRAVYLASPFPPVPDSLSKGGLPIYCTFKYLIQGSGLTKNELR